MSTPARQPLTRARILEVAIDLVDHEGANALTMRRLGNELDVEAMSLYNHVENKQDVLDGMAGFLVARMTGITEPADNWQETVARIARAYRGVIMAHPNVFLLSAGRPLVSGDDWEQFDAVFTRLQNAGFSPELALDVFNACAGLVRGFAVGEAAYADVPMAGGVVWDEDRSFERGLQALINGFALMLEHEPDSLLHQG